MNSDGLYGPLKILFFFESSPPRSWVIRLTGNIFVSLRNPSLGFIPSMEKQSTQPICGQEALQLLNCVAESPFDQEKCVRFLQSLRECVLSKVGFLSL